MYKGIVHFCLFATLAVLSCLDADAQMRKPPADERFLALVDSNTVKWRNKLYPHTPAGDLNVHGFEEADIPVYADSVYAYRLSLLESEVPLDYNEYVRPYIDLYTIRKRKLSSKVLAWSKYYFPQFEEALDRAGMPLEIKYLAVIESALNPMATSPVGAAGMWQFMAPTGRIYGLKTTHYYDERRDVAKATEAAIKYLKNSYRAYGDWLLVIASYNCGPGNVNKAIRKAGGVKNFWKIQHFLPRETRGYVPAFIAAAYMMSYAAEHNLYPSEECGINFHLDTVHVDNRYTIPQLADVLCMSAEDLKQLNPALRKGSIPFTTGPVTLTLPYDKVIRFTELSNDTNFKSRLDENLIAANHKAARERSMARAKTITYKVKRGDLLSTIAEKYDVTVKELKKWNGLRSNKIAAGRKIRIRINQT